MFDAPAWGEDVAGVEASLPISLFDSAEDTFFGDARALFAPKAPTVTPPPTPGETKATLQLVHAVSWDGSSRDAPQVPVVQDDDELSAETLPAPPRKRRKSSTGPLKKTSKARGQACPSELRWASERDADGVDTTMPATRPVGISLASGSSSGWRLRIAGTQLGHYATAAQAWAAYPRASF